MKIQVAEDAFVHIQGPREDQIDLGCRQIFAYAMCHYPAMLKEPIKKDRVKKATLTADHVVLRCFGDLADELGFGGDGVATLQQYLASRPLRDSLPRSKPVLVTSGSGFSKA